ncbi:ribosomal RNA processing protein 36 homolog [Schistocerca gregaria]|uniref:ribosomal RNA processing protein 36 homolog n=1 Tax=Schistocerca gregaria TaxID=7010 RepID=UPI00211E61A2|nr:ribosomal RNA processing protein 36 homolog [Schistocerca gregaria]
MSDEGSGEATDGSYDSEYSDQDLDANELSFELRKKLDARASRAPVKKTSLIARRNKNAPVVRSAKQPVPAKTAVLSLSSLPPKAKPRDPRFDSATEDFDYGLFKHRYGFIDEIRANECEELKKAIEKAEEPDEQDRLKSALILLQSRQKSEQEKQLRQKIKSRYIKEERERVLKGKKPFYAKRDMLKKLIMKEKLERLEKQGSVDKYLTRKRKKQAAKDKRVLQKRRTSFPADQ